MKGSIELPLWLGQHYIVSGGPYLRKPEGYVGVKMAAEIIAPCEVDIPVEDFSIPKTSDFENGVRAALALIISGKPVYVGCMGGIGRTGLMLAGLAKAFGVQSPIFYVRQNYFSSSVETHEQMRFVDKWEVPADVKLIIFLARIKSLFMRKKMLTNFKT